MISIKKKNINAQSSTIYYKLHQTIVERVYLAIIMLIAWNDYINISLET